MRFRKKPVEIEAMRLTQDTLWDIQQWLANYGSGSYPAFDGSGLIIPTLEGDMEGRWGDWIIKEPFPTDDRQFYPCKPDIFDKTYDAVEES